MNGIHEPPFASDAICPTTPLLWCYLVLSLPCCLSLGMDTRERERERENERDAHGLPCLPTRLTPLRWAATGEPNRPTLPSLPAR